MSWYSPPARRPANRTRTGDKKPQPKTNARIVLVRRLELRENAHASGSLKCHRIKFRVRASLVRSSRARATQLTRPRHGASHPQQTQSPNPQELPPYPGKVASMFCREVRNLHVAPRVCPPGPCAAWGRGREGAPCTSYNVNSARGGLPHSPPWAPTPARETCTFKGCVAPWRDTFPAERAAGRASCRVTTWHELGRCVIRCPHVKMSCNLTRKYFPQRKHTPSRTISVLDVRY